jgi:lysophospholipase L1-like esterase
MPLGRFVRLSLAWLCAIAIGAIVGEVATRLTGIVDAVSVVPRRLLVPTGDPLLPYRLRPGARSISMGVPVRVNRFGLRGAEIAGDPPDGVRRILVLGDSVAYGWGLAEADTLPVLLEDELLRLGREVEVLNAGVPGYDTQSAVALLRHSGLSLAPDELVLSVSLNDFEATPRLSPLGLLLAGAAGTDDSWLVTHSEFYFLLRWAAPALLKQRWQRWTDSEAASGRDQRVQEFLRRQAIARRERFYADPSGPGWERIRRALEDLREIVVRHDLELTIVVFPEEDQLGSVESELEPQVRWKALCAQLELSCLDLWRAFRGSPAGESLFRDLQHPNALGMRVAASATAGLIAR